MTTFAERLRQQFEDEVAVREALDAYFASDGDVFTGSRFELVADFSHPDEFTARDLVAVSMLSVEVPPRVAYWLLSAEGQLATRPLLASVPTTVDIWDAVASGLLARGEPLWGLWDLLNRAAWPHPEAGNGMGPTTISKLLAAKRPRLVPVWDSVIERVLGPIDGFWDDMHGALTHDELRAFICDATVDAPPHVPLLRRIDAVIWYRNRSR
jgi:hypothetical protein